MQEPDVGVARDIAHDMENEYCHEIRGLKAQINDLRKVNDARTIVAMDAIVSAAEASYKADGETREIQCLRRKLDNAQRFAGTLQIGSRDPPGEGWLPSAFDQEGN